MLDPISSVVVVTYNSSETIIDTLESIKIQNNRKFIEIVVSDDCSNDNTVEIVNDWLSANNQIFNSVVLLENDKNLGITKNFNKAVKRAKGQFIKLLAGDDQLFSSNSIEAYVREIGSKQIIFSPVSIFGCSDSEYFSKKEIDKFKSFLTFNEKGRKGAVFYNSPLAPKITGSFFRKQLLADMGFFDEKYRMMEDYPFMLNVFKNHYEDICYYDKQLFNYRLRPAFSPEFNLSKRKIEHVYYLNKFRKDTVLPLLYKEGYFKLFTLTYIRMVLSKYEIKSQFFGKFIFNLRRVLNRN